MLKRDLSDLISDAKLLYITAVQAIKKNFVVGFIIVLAYFLLFFVDPIIRNWFATIHNNIYDFIFNAGHYYGKPNITLLAILILYPAGIILKKEKVRKAGVMFWESFLFSGMIVTIIKSLLGRWRPYTGHGNFSYVFMTFGPNDHLSLPSGDVAVAFAFSSIAAGLMDNIVWKIFWYALATITSIGRIYHDQHWLTDVILAAFISICIGNFIIMMSRVREEL